MYEFGQRTIGPTEEEHLDLIALREFVALELIFDLFISLLSLLFLCAHSTTHLDGVRSVGSGCGLDGNIVERGIDILHQRVVSPTDELFLGQMCETMHESEMCCAKFIVMVIAVQCKARAGTLPQVARGGTLTTGISPARLRLYRG